MTDSILLTGGTGFVGQHVLSELLRNNLKVSLVTRSYIECDSRINVIRTKNLFAEPKEFWQEICSDHDSVIHAAWYVEPGKYLHSPLNFECLSGTLSLAKGAIAAGISHFQGLGTCFEYDLTDDYRAINQPIATNFQLHPTTPYGLAKASAFLLLQNIIPREKFAWSRIFYLYGEGEDSRRLVPYICSQLSKGEVAELTSGRKVRDYMDVTEASKKIVEISLSRLTGPLNVCSGKAVTISDFAMNIAEKFGRPDLIRFGGIPRRADDPNYIVGVPSL